MSKPLQNEGLRGDMPGNRTSREEGKVFSRPLRLEGNNDDEGDTHQAMKSNKVFKELFESLDRLSLKVINEKEWDCPACKGGSYKGIQGLIEHAKIKKYCNGRLHQKLVKVLEEEMKRRGVASTVAQHVYGKWLGLEDVLGDYEIVWPPVVVVQNTNFDLLENQQRALGMGTKEILECFKKYKPVKAKYAYGPKGHCGISLLIFEDSTLGYLEAEHLHKDFRKEGRGRDKWDGLGTLNHQVGKRILYGYIATREDIENFNKYSTKAKVKYDMVPYQSKVIEPVKKMKEESQKVGWLETKIIEDQESTKRLEESINNMAEKLQVQREDMKILMQKIVEQDEECKKGLDYLENIYKQEIDRLKGDARGGIRIKKMQSINNVTAKTISI